MPTKSKILFDQIPISDVPILTSEFITVACKYCGERMTPLYQQIRSRLCSLRVTTKGESNFYCSDKCKKDCPLYNFNTSKMIDPESKLHVDKAEQQMVGACQTDHLKQLQLDEFGYNYCEKCGDKGDIELHHTLPIAQAGIDAINSSVHIIVCRKCHNEFRVCVA